MSIVREDSHAKVDIRLARPHYRVGGTVVGSIRLLQSNGDTVLTLTALGGCKLDDRWHKTTSHDMYDPHPTDDLPPLDRTLPFWMSGSIPLTQLEERTIHSWHDTKPKPILGRQQPADDDATGDAWKQDQTKKLYTFRFQLPHDGPPSLIATSCRYYYLIALKLETLTNQSCTWVKVPFTVLTKAPQNNHPVTNSFQAMAHSNGLPVPLTAMELNQPEGNYSVQRNSFCSTMFGHNNNGIPTLDIIDPTSRGSAGTLALLGGAQPLHPGSRVMVRLDFETATLPVHQVSASLQGTEVARCVSLKKSSRARRYIFDTAHQVVDPDTIETLSLHLFLPETAPVTLGTEQIEITVRILLDLCVQRQEKAAGSCVFGNVHLEIPCQVVHRVYDWERDVPEEVPGGTLYQDLNEQVAQRSRSDNPNHPTSFASVDIVEDLKVLSLSLADDMGLRPLPC